MSAAQTTEIVDESFVPYRVAAHYLSEKLKENGIAMPKVGIICGSGLSELSKALDGKTLRYVVRLVTKQPPSAEKATNEDEAWCCGGRIVAEFGN